MRTAIISNQHLDLLKSEYVIKNFDGLVNILHRSGKIGNGILTNLRFVWYSTIVENFNISIPLIILPEVSIVNHSRFQKCFYLKIDHIDKTMLFGFTFGKHDLLEDFVQTLNKARESALLNPMLTYPTHRTVSADNDNQNNDNEDFVHSLTDSLDFEEFRWEKSDPILQFYDFDQSDDDDKLFPITFDKTIGLSIEQSDLQTSASSLWEHASKSKLKTLAEI